VKLAYLTTCFGTPSHTFIRRELRRFEELGVVVELFGIRKDQTLSDDSRDLVERTHYLYPVRWARVAYLNAQYLFKYPGRYMGCVADCLSSSNGALKNRAKLLYHLAVSVGHAKLVQQRGITHIHAHFLHAPSSVAMFCSRLTGVPFSITVHSAGERHLSHVIGIPLKLKHAQKLVMISRFNIDDYSLSYPCQDKSVVIRCGMAVDDFAFQPVSSEGAQVLQLLAVGRMVEKKGFEYLVQAAALLKRQNFPFHLKILGYGPLHEQLRKMVEELGLLGQVDLPGKMSSEEVQRHMAGAHVVVVPSVTDRDGGMEGIPVVIMEAMALGIPVIATRHSGIPEVVRDDTGTLVPERDAEALARAIVDFTYDGQKITRARALIEHEFDIKNVVDARLQLFST